MTLFHRRLQSRGLKVSTENGQVTKTRVIQWGRRRGRTIGKVTLKHFPRKSHITVESKYFLDDSTDTLKRNDDCDRFFSRDRNTRL